jgi:hypothetical protein
VLCVGVTNKQREISVFHLGGILRDVRLLALPQDYISRLHMETDFDAAYQDATLHVTVAAVLGQDEKAQVQLALTDPQGNSVAITPDAAALSAEVSEMTLAIPVAAPTKWDAEHPNLYTLTATLSVGGVAVERLSKRFGFKDIQVRGNQLFVNGNEVKLRGVCRHDVYPKTGRAITHELVLKDVAEFKAANVNFVRTSHYPPREDFLDACDEAGIYVEDEIAVAFVYQSINPTQNDPEYTAAYMNQFTEMIERDRSHACVLMWSLANESYWGRNFQMEYDYARAEDPKHPTIFSYPITQPEGTNAYEIWSLHYAEWNHDPAEMEDNHSVGQQWGKRAPVLHDEYIHLPCYDLSEQRRDPAIREFWGESIKRFWEGILTHQGALGGATWGSIDDVMIVPGGTRGREWGIIDGWRRRKPEHWLAKKGYSPIRIQDEPLPNPGKGKALSVPVANWYDHTNLNEVRIEWSVGADKGVITDLDVAPHTQGAITLPARAWQDGEAVDLRFIEANGNMVDAYRLPIGGWVRARSTPQGPAPSLTEDRVRIVVEGADFELVFDKATGQIAQGSYKGNVVIAGGPHLNLIGFPMATWSGKTISARVVGEQAVVDIAGAYGPVKVRFSLAIDGRGLITTTYTIDDLPMAPPRSRKMRVGLDVGGYREVGVSYTLSSQVDRLAWDRKGLWSVYPDDHIAAPQGSALRVRPQGQDRFGVPPQWSWGEDMRNFWLFGKYDPGGRGTEAFRSQKFNIWSADAILGGARAALRAESDGSDAVRLEVLDNPATKIDDRDPRVKLVGSWVRMDGEPGSYQATEVYSNKAGDYAELTFSGTGACWIGSKDLIMGMADVYVDGAKQAAGIDLCAPLNHGATRGEEKVYQNALFTVEGLPAGEHTLRVVVTGAKNARSNNAYVSIDAFLVLGTGIEGDVRMYINNAWNYPELSWGCWVKEPIFIESGYSNKVTVRLTSAP